MQYILGGAEAYAGRDITSVHHAMVERQGLAQRHFDRVMQAGAAAAHAQRLAAACCCCSACRCSKAPTRMHAPLSSPPRPARRTQHMHAVLAELGASGGTVAQCMANIRATLPLFRFPPEGQAEGGTPQAEGQAEHAGGEGELEGAALATGAGEAEHAGAIKPEQEATTQLFSASEAVATAVGLGEPRTAAEVPPMQTVPAPAVALPAASGGARASSPALQVAPPPAAASNSSATSGEWVHVELRPARGPAAEVSLVLVSQPASPASEAGSSVEEKPPSPPGGAAEGAASPAAAAKPAPRPSSPAPWPLPPAAAATIGALHTLTSGIQQLLPALSGKRRSQPGSPRGEFALINPSLVVAAAAAALSAAHLAAAFAPRRPAAA